MTSHTGSIPQNVNFAIKASVVSNILREKGINYETAVSEIELKTVDIFDKAKKFTVLVECFQ
jgi:ribosomal protein L25 (general stress protein Ctc)